MVLARSHERIVLLFLEDSGRMRSHRIPNLDPRPHRYAAHRGYLDQIVTSVQDDVESAAAFLVHEHCTSENHTALSLRDYGSPAQDLRELAMPSCFFDALEACCSSDCSGWRVAPPWLFRQLGMKRTPIEDRPEH